MAVGSSRSAGRASARRRALSREEIIGAAIALTEEVGIGGLSMRSLGSRIGTSAMAVYRYVPSREALLDAMVGRVLAAVELPAPEVAWQERLRAVAHGLLDAAHANPTVFVMVLSRVYRADEAVAVMAAMYQILADAGIAPDDLPRIERLISTALIGFAVADSNNAFWPTDPAVAAVRIGAQQAASRPGADRGRAELDRNVDDLVELVTAVAGDHR